MAKSQTLTVPFHLPLDAGTQSNGSDLSKKISQIIEQEGHFRDLTEAKFDVEESSDEETTSPHQVASLNETGNLTSQKRAERLWSSKDVMIEHWKKGVDELLTTLDFLSLLISKQSAAASAGLSEGLRGAKVPPASFEPRVVKVSQPLTSKTLQEAEVSKGWKARGFESAFGKLSAASERLTKEAQQESEFWTEAAALKDSGWKLSRHPRDSKAIGLHFGMAESATQFRSRGFALLRQGGKGNIFLDRVAPLDREKRLIIRIEEDGREMASRCALMSLGGEERDTNNLAVQARDELLEAELFHEISREARLVSNQDVIVKEQNVSFRIGQRCRVVISFEAVDSNPTTSHEHDGMVTCVWLSLKALLLAAHSTNQQNRSQTPDAITARPKVLKELAILRLLVANLRHQAAMEALLTRIRTTILQPCEQAAITIRIDRRLSPESDPTNSSQRHLTILSTEPVASTIDLVLPNNKSVELRIVSSMGHPIYGTSYDISPVDFAFIKSTAKSYTALEATIDALRRLVLLAIVDMVQSSTPANGKWEGSILQRGELSYHSASTTKVDLKIRMQLQSQTFTLRVIPGSERYGSKKKVAACSWDATGARVLGDASTILAAIGESKESGLMSVISKLTDF